VTVSTAPGWYGKLPTLGDFASRRLEADWIQPWDTWLATGLQALREASPDGWLDHYLASPAWRFVLMPGALPMASNWGDSRVQVGVLVPSVDRVGRYFPLVVVSPPLAAPTHAGQAQALWQWAGQLQDIAVAALHDDWLPEQLDQTLASVAQPPDVPGTPPEPWALVCHQAAWQALQGHSLWFSSDGVRAPLTAAGLPSGASFASLFTPAS
jgi:type VI secretion system protein ImpM